MLFKRSKDLGQPLNSVDGLKYLSKIWFIIGTKPPEVTQHFQRRLRYYFYSVAINFVCSFCFTATTLINLIFIDSFQELVANLSVSVSILLAVIKQLAVLKHGRTLLKSNEYLKLLDERSNQHLLDRKTILNAIHYSNLYVLYLPVYVFCGCGFAYNGWTNHQLIYNAWFPNFFAKSEDNYLAAFIFQCFSQIFVGCQSVFNDTFHSCYLTLMIAQMECLANRISRIGWEKGRSQQSSEANIEELKNCVKDHKNLLGYFDCIRPLISITLFFQFLSTALALCLTAIDLTFFSPDLNQQFFTLLYLVILLCQVFPCCWHVNVLMEKSDYLTTAMYSCNWMDQNKTFRKMLIIFMQRSQKTNTILAGNLAPVTLRTFLAIIRFSFSMYTILSKM